MNDFVRCNKVSRVYWLKTSVENLKINIKIKPPDDILSLPKFEDFTSSSDSITIEPNIEEHTFKWQEKIFCCREIHLYSEIHNCDTQNEINYHERIKNDEITSSKVFTYINEDCCMPSPGSKTPMISKLEQCMEYLNLDDSVGSIGRVLGRKTDSMHHLLKSRSSLFEEDKWKTMHVVYDYSDPNEDLFRDSQYPKQEYTLLSIYHNTTHDYIILSPDVNDLDWNPYAAEGLDLKYGVQVDFGAVSGGEELETLLTRLHSKWEKKHKALVNFIAPSLGKTQYYITIELLTAGGFEMDRLYIEYTIKLPEGVQCNDTLHGRTHTAASTAVGGEDVWNFGHLIELSLETEVSDPPPLKLYLEAISIDRHHKHRTEGYAYHPVPFTPGLQTLEVTCLRPEEKSWRGEERRFFLGGCNLLDLEVLSRTDGQNTNFNQTTTGTFHLRYSTISQSLHSLGTGCGFPPSSGSALLLGAEAALSQYKRARARLAAATKNMTIGSGDAT